MKKVQAYIEKLKGIENWDAYLMRESGLPGPRGNLELVQAVAEIGNEEKSGNTNEKESAFYLGKMNFFSSAVTSSMISGRRGSLGSVGISSTWPAIGIVTGTGGTLSRVNSDGSETPARFAMR